MSEFNNNLSNINNDDFKQKDEDFQLIKNDDKDNIDTGDVSDDTSMSCDSNYETEEESEEEAEEAEEEEAEEAEEEEAEEAEEEEEAEEVEEEEEAEEEPINQIEQLLINPALTGIQLPDNFVNFMEQQVDNLINKTFNNACDIMYNLNPDVLKHIENVYLTNVAYHDDDLITLIKYTIRMALNINSNYELDEISAGIMYMGLTGSNVVFETNYDTCIQIIKHELKTIYNRSYIHAFLESIMNPNMEDVKKVLSEEELGKIHTCQFKELDDNQKNSNCKCTVCQEEFCPKDKVRCLPCKHVYHQECVDGWLTSHSHKCPCCRAEAGAYIFKE